MIVKIDSFWIELSSHKAASIWDVGKNIKMHPKKICELKKCFGCKRFPSYWEDVCNDCFYFGCGKCNKIIIVDKSISFGKPMFIKKFKEKAFFHPLLLTEVCDLAIKWNKLNEK